MLTVDALLVNYQTSLTRGLLSSSSAILFCAVSMKYLFRVNVFHFHKQLLVSKETVVACQRSSETIITQLFKYEHH